MKKTKTQKGITLIALIITIVVLLILAVVAIGAVQNTGIIEHAQNATSEYKEKQQEEEDILEGYNKDLIAATVKWSTKPTEGTWYVSDDCLLFDEDGYVYGFKIDFDWCQEIGYTYPVYGVYDTGMNNAGTTKIVFSSNVNKIKNGDDTEDDFWKLVNYELKETVGGNKAVEFLASSVQFDTNFTGMASDITNYTVAKCFKNLSNGFFYGCTSLTELTIPSSVESIAENAFAGLGYSGTQVTVKVVKGSVADEWITKVVNEDDNNYHKGSYITIQYITE